MCTASAALRVSTREYRQVPLVTSDLDAAAAPAVRRRHGTAHHFAAHAAAAVTTRSIDSIGLPHRPTSRSVWLCTADSLTSQSHYSRASQSVQGNAMRMEYVSTLKDYKDHCAAGVPALGAVGAAPAEQCATAALRAAAAICTSAVVRARRAARAAVACAGWRYSAARRRPARRTRTVSSRSQLSPIVL